MAIHSSLKSYQGHKAKETKKYITIPAYAPLYAMAKCHGPTTGPVKTPIAVPISIIGELLTQRTSTPRIFEVVPIDIVHKKYSKPVELTLANYKLPYNEISPEPVYFDSEKPATAEIITPAVQETSHEAASSDTAEDSIETTGYIEVIGHIVTEPVETITATESVIVSTDITSESPNAAEASVDTDTDDETADNANTSTTYYASTNKKLSKSERRRLARERQKQEEPADVANDGVTLEQ